ncbi:Ubiquitin-like modifier-activating enzyme 5, partial [Caligus rogercresseyi]
AVETPVVEEEKVVHEDNEWGISLVDEDCGDAGAQNKTEVAKGIQLAYEKPKATEDSSKPSTTEGQEKSLEELMAELGSV